MDPVASEIVVACKSEARALWGSIADTERLNRALGMTKLSLRPLNDGSAARYLVSTRRGGFSLEYEERPFEWVYPESFGIVRKMRSGPFSSIETNFLLSPTPNGGTAVTARLLVVPRLSILRGGIRLIGAQVVKNIAAEIRRVDADLAVGGTGRLRTPRGALQQDALARVERALRDLAPADLVQRLVRFVAEADDVEVGRIRPFALADAWGVDRRALLGTCLAAVRAGLLELQWAVNCPSCRGASEALPSLSSLASHGTCQLCEIQFAVDLDEAVEAMFSPAPAIRAVDLGTYCIGGPSLTPHVLAQAILPSRGASHLKCPAEEGRYRIFFRGGATVPLEIMKGAPAHGRASVNALVTDPALTVAPSGMLTIDNPRAEEIHAKIERMTWTEQAATARTVVTMPGFRRDFSQDILRPGIALKVANVCLFFSDLTGSTQLYADAGDATAFKLVHDHFDVVIGLIEKGRGTLVKTIGDAVMAAFADDLDGLLASVAILHAYEAFRGVDPTRCRTHIKLGVFGGPCYVVTANSVLDYFGQTVNIAARLQGEATSGELVVTADLAARAIAARAIPEAFVKERYEARLKGVKDPIAAVRIQVPRS